MTSVHRTQLTLDWFCAANDDKINDLVSSLPWLPSSSICEKTKHVSIIRPSTRVGNERVIFVRKMRLYITWAMRCNVYRNWFGFQSRRIAALLFRTTGPYLYFFLLFVSLHTLTLLLCSVDPARTTSIYNTMYDDDDGLLLWKTFASSPGKREREERFFD